MSRVQLGYTCFSPLLSHKHRARLTQLGVSFCLYYVRIMVCHPKGKANPFSLEILARQTIY